MDSPVEAANQPPEPRLAVLRLTGKRRERLWCVTRLNQKVRPELLVNPGWRRAIPPPFAEFASTVPTD